MLVTDLYNTTWKFNSTITTPKANYFVYGDTLDTSKIHLNVYNSNCVPGQLFSLNNKSTPVSFLVRFDRKFAVITVDGVSDYLDFNLLCNERITFYSGFNADDGFITWLEANATLVEEEPTATVITYNGSTIATLEAGQTATIKTAETEVDYDIVVKAGEQKEPSLQEKTATENGDVLPDEGYDGLSKVTVDVQNSGGGGGITTSAKSQKSESRYVSTQMGAITTTATVSVA